MATTHQQCLAVRESLSPAARELLEIILNGEAMYGHVASLYVHLGTKELKAQTLLCLHRWGAPPDVLRMCIRHFWKVDNRVILNSDEFTLQSARELFQQARFPPPCGLGPIIQVWRGTAGRTKEEACAGLSWTRDRDAACWFATQRGEGKARTPLVVTALVRLDQILFCDDECDGLYEQEVVLDTVESGEIDGVVREWRERGEHFAKRRNAAQRGEPYK